MPTADDEAMFAVISSASIACGGHAGDAASMREAVDRAARLGVAVGAHPCYADRAGFGRLATATTPAELARSLAAAARRARGAGADIRYVKPHGALYHASSRDRRAGPRGRRGDRRFARAARPARSRSSASPARSPRAAPAPACPSCARRSSTAATCPTARSCPRGEPGALLDDPEVVAARALRLVREGVVEAIDGTLVAADAASLCVHGDSPAAVAMARAVRAALDAAGIEVRAPW